MSTLNKSYPSEVKEVDLGQIEQLKNYFDDTYFNLFATRCGPKGYLLSKEFRTIGPEIYNMEIRPTDIFLVGFPKSGTTWTQELIWLIVNDFNYEEAAATQLNTRFPYLESSVLMNIEMWLTICKDEKLKESIRKGVYGKISMEKLNNLSSPRFLKSHLPISLLPPNLLDTCKVVYIARDPRDVAVSFYYNSKLLNMLKKDSDFKTFWNFFINDLISWTPFFEHIKEAWESRHHPNMLFLFYEELSKDLPACARRIAKFLDKEVTDKQIQKLCDHLKFDNFKKNTAVNLKHLQQKGLFNQNGSFIREGKVGGWRKHFDDEMTQQAKQWMEDNLRDTDFRFPQ